MERQDCAIYGLPGGPDCVVFNPGIHNNATLDSSTNMFYIFNLSARYFLLVLSNTVNWATKKGLLQILLSYLSTKTHTPNVHNDTKVKQSSVTVKWDIIKETTKKTSTYCSNIEKVHKINKQ